MSRIVVLKGIDGSVAIMSLAEGASKLKAVEKFRDSHQKGFYPEYYDYKDELPLDREYRDAWTFKDNKIVVDESKAKDIRIERMRQARDMELDKLDKEQLRVLTDVNKLEEIEKKKQELRDMSFN